MSKTTLKKWHEVCPRGSDDQKFFIGADGKSGLVRGNFDWRSTSSIAKESGLSQERVEELIQKYLKMGVILPHENKEEHWGYWLRVKPELGGGVSPASLAKKDQKNRIASKTAKKP